MATSGEILKVQTPEERLNQLCNGNEEDQDFREFEGQTFVYMKGKYRFFSNFVMRISSHGYLEDGSCVYFLSCFQETMGQMEFEVDVCLSDLDSFRKVYNKFKVSRPTGSRMIYEVGNKGAIHLAIGNLVSEYENLENDLKTCVLTASKPGYLDTGIDGIKVFVLGPDSMIPATAGCDDDIISDLKLKWIGAKPQHNLKVGPKLEESDILNLLETLKLYHGLNFPSILMMIAFSKLAVNLSNIEHNYNLPSCHLVGEMGTGKSRAADHMRSMLPFILNQSGSKSVMRLDNPTEPVLNKLLCISGSICIFDPPPALKEAAMNKILDQAYQGVITRTHNNSQESLKVSTGPLFVHAHEKKNMKTFTPTSLSKSVVGVHKRIVSADHENMSAIDQDIMNNFEVHSAMFRFIVIPLDPDDLENNKNRFTKTLKSLLKENFTQDVLDMNSRLIQNYALFLSSLTQLLCDMALPEASCSDLETKLLSFFSEICIPENLRSIQCSLGEKVSQRYAPDTLVEEMIKKMSAMDLRLLFQNIWLGQKKKCLHISKDLFKDPSPKLREAQKMLDRHFPLTRLIIISLLEIIHVFLNSMTGFLVILRSAT